MERCRSEPERDSQPICSFNGTSQPKEQSHLSHLSFSMNVEAVKQLVWLEKLPPPPSLFCVAFVLPFSLQATSHHSLQQTRTRGHGELQVSIHASHYQGMSGFYEPV